MGESRRHWKYKGLLDVAFMGDLKFSFGCTSRGHFLRVESMSDADLPPIERELKLPASHKFLDVAASGGVE